MTDSSMKDLLDWLICLLWLQSVCCLKYSTKATNFSILNLFLHFLLSWNLRIFVTVMWSKFYCLLKFSRTGTWKGILLILSCGVLLAWFSMLEITSIWIILYLHFPNGGSSLKLWRWCQPQTLFPLKMKK